MEQIENSGLLDQHKQLSETIITLENVLSRIDDSEEPGVYDGSKSIRKPE